MIRFNHKILTLFLGLAIVLIGCGRQAAPPQDGVVAATDGKPLPTDSAKALFERVDHYYKNVIHDSLALIVPEAKAWFGQHGHWKEYYTTWCLYVNDLVWGGKMELGLDEARKMHADAIRRKSDFGLMEAYTAMGIAYHYMGNDDESSHCYDEALRLYPEDADQSVKQNIYSYYCQVLLDIKAYQKADSVFQHWYDSMQKLSADNPGDPSNIHAHFRFHREYYKMQYALKDYRRAAMGLDSMTYWLAREDDRQLYEAQTARLRAQLSAAQGNFAKAMQYSDSALTLARALDHNTYLYALQQRADMLRQFGHYREALDAYTDYAQQRDSLIKADSQQQLNELNKRFELDELKAQQERTAFEQQRTLFRMVALFGGLFIAGLALFAVLQLRSARRLRVANQRAEESSRMKTDFMRQISHEIRTPLNIVSGFTQILTNPNMELGDEERTDIGQRITESANRITNLVGKMLDLAEANSQTVIERQDDVSAAEVARKAIEESGIGEARHITFTEQLSPEAGDIRLETSLRHASRALASLLENAQKFTKEGSVTLSIARGHKSVDFIVEDTGIGVPTEEAERIFDEFVQLDEYYDGTGIGLTVARSIARRLGGDVRLDTTYTAGARFVLRLAGRLRLWLTVATVMMATASFADDAKVEQRLRDFEKHETAQGANAFLEALRAEEFFDEPIRFTANDPKDTVMQQVCYWAAEWYYDRAEYQQAVNYASKAIPLYHFGVEKSDCLSLLAISHIRLGDYQEAAEYAKQCYAIDKRLDDADRQSSSLNTLGTIYLYANLPKEAEKYVLRGIEMAEQTGNTARLAVLKGKASEVYHALGNDEEALKYAESAYQIDKQAGREAKAAVRQAQLASVLLGLHRYEEAEKALADVIPFFRKSDDRQNLGISCNKMGTALLSQKRSDKAVGYYREAADIFAAIGDMANEVQARRGLYESLWKSDPDAAKTELDRFNTLKDSIYNNVSAESLARYNAEFGNDWLKQENYAERSARIWLMVIASALALAVVAVFLLMRRRHRRQALINERLNTDISELREKYLQLNTHYDNMVHTVPDAADTEELNDQDKAFLTQTLTTINRQIDEGRVNVDDLASDLCMSASQFRRRLTALTGETPQSYIQNIRMQKARHLLDTQPGLAIAEVAFRCGYDEKANFTRAFKKYYGITPSDYQNGHRA